MTTREARKPLIVAGVVLAYLVGVLAVIGNPLVTRVFYLRQDAAGGIVLILAMLVLYGVGERMRWQPRLGNAVSLPVILCLAAVVMLATWYGAHAIMLDYPLTRDEVMAVFDAGIFARGHLAQPVTPEWRPFLDALVPSFTVPTAGDAATVSSYLPGNSLMRAGFGRFADPALLNPLLAAVGLVATWDCARRLFADTPEAQWVVVAGYVLSAQVLVNAMTSYAMTQHLAASAVWLALFLRDRPWSHALAMVLGLWAMGIHQLAFHPLFAGPIILTLLARRRWVLFGVYAIVYAAGLLGWLFYTGYAIASIGAAPQVGAGGGGAGNYFSERILPLIESLNLFSIPLTMYNLLRYFVWNAGFALPLLIAAWPVARRGELTALALFGSVLATTLVVTLLMAYQGHGWGYRYWHAEIPALLLLGGYGLREWMAHDRALALRSVVALAGVSVLLLPFLLFQAHAFVSPYAALSARIERQPAQFVIIETDPPGSAIDQVRNRADMTNRPLIFASNAMTPERVQELCRRGTLTFLRKREFHLVPFGVKLASADKAYDAVESWLRSQPCWREPVR